MRIRGRRECLDCGERWSYFEVGTVTCPRCDSVRSTAVDDEPVRHTAGQSTIDLSAARGAVDTRPLRDVAALAAEAVRSYLTDRGFIAAGELQPLDDVTVAAAELQAASDRIRRTMITDEATERYLLDLLRGVPAGERPDTVPETLRAARGLGAAVAVDRYRVDALRYLDDHPDADARVLVGTLRDHLRRVEALDGDVPVETANGLVAAARDLGEYLRGDDVALTRASDRLSRL